MSYGKKGLELIKQDIKLTAQANRGANFHITESFTVVFKMRKV